MSTKQAEYERLKKEHERTSALIELIERQRVELLVCAAADTPEERRAVMGALRSFYAKSGSA